MKLTQIQENRLADFKMQGTMTRQDVEDYIELLAIEGKVIKKVDEKLSTSKGDSTVVDPKDTTENLIKGDGMGERGGRGSTSEGKPEERPDVKVSQEDEKSDKTSKKGK